MIASLHGQVVQIEDNALVIEMGGLGLRVLVPQPLLGRARVGETLLLQTHLIVREDALTLYGFENTTDRRLFHLLLGVDGVGPKAALSVLSTLDADIVSRAVFNEQEEILNRVPGIGKKTAQKIILSLHDRLKPVSSLEQLASLTDVDSEVMAALTALGYSIVEAQRAIQSLPKDAPKETEERLRLALQNI